MTAERVAGIERIIERNVPMPSPITNAHLIEVQIGNDVFGPADYSSYIWIKVAAEDREEWRRTFVPSWR